jgi:hypothetical protein
VDTTGAAGDSSARPQLTVAQKLESLPQMVQGLHSADPAVQHEATLQFRKLLSVERNPPIEEVIRAGVVPTLVQFLTRSDHWQLQFEAAWALTNIASGKSEDTHVVINMGAVPIFVQLLSSPVEDVREQAIWALGNIAGDSAQCRDLVLDAQALQPLLSQLNQQAKISMMRNATWTLSNFCRGKPATDFERVKVALPYLNHLINLTDEEVLADACWALSYLSDGNDDKIQGVIRAGVVKRLVELLGHPRTSVLIPALRTVGNIVTGDDSQTQVVINCGALGQLLQLLVNPEHKKSIKKEACWTISNITAGNKTQIQAVMDAGIIPPIVHLLANGEFDIKKEATWAISNATSGGTHEQIKALVRWNCIKPLCDLLATGSDPKIIVVALEGLENILRVGKNDQKLAGPEAVNEFAEMIDEADGLVKIEELQTHSRNDIYEKVVNILEKYFGVEGEEDENLAPKVDDAQGMYAFGQAPAAAPQGGFNFGAVQSMD